MKYEAKLIKYTENEIVLDSQSSHTKSERESRH